jgi:LysR family glycine cleavage system transcriptional activator
MKRMPPLNALRAFDVAGHHLNFRSAADQLGVTQAAVAQQVRLLETHLGMTLFERLPKGLAFTASGRSYHARVASAFEELRAATDTLHPEPDKIVVSVTPSVAAKWLIPNLPDLFAAHPEIDLRVLATEKVSSFHSDGIDFAIRHGSPPFAAALDAMLLFRQDAIAVAAPSLLEGRHLPLGNDALSRLPKLHDMHDLWPAFLKELGTEDRAGYGLRLSHTTLTIDAAVSGQGAALVSKFLVKRELALNLLVQISPQVLLGKRDFYLLVAPRQKQSASVQTIVDWLVDKAAAEN